MKRLLCIVGGMNVGGAETFLMKLYRSIDREKYQMDFAVAISGEGAYDKEILSFGGKIYHIRAKSKGLLRNFKDVKRIVKENGYNYVMRVSQHSLSALELLAAKKGGAKVCAFRSSNSGTDSQSAKEKLLHKLCLFMPKYYANVKIAPSTEAARFMFGNKCVAKNEVHILHNAVDLGVYHFDEQARKNIRNEFSVDENAKIIGHIGRFAPQKNHSFLIDVFNEISKKEPDAVFMIVGKGELEEQIKTKVKDLGLEKKVIFTGVRTDIPALLSAMDAFVFPSFYEGMPNTVIEAQSTGLPCIISDSITKEANVTGLVKFLPLSDSVETWSDTALNDIGTSDRNSVKEKFITNRYDIQSVVKDFTQIIFGE